MLGFDETLCAGIDDFNVCVLLGFDERLCAGIHYCMCILLDFCDRLCAGIDYCMCVCVFMQKSCDFART